MLNFIALALVFMVYVNNSGLIKQHDLLEPNKINAFTYIFTEDACFIQRKQFNFH